MILNVKVIPNASQNEVVGFEGDVLKIKCTASPEKGKANTAVVAILAQHYKVPKNKVKILRGKTHSRKTIAIAE